MRNQKGNALVFILIGLAVLGAGTYFFLTKDKEKLPSTTTPVTLEGEEISFMTPKKAAHYESNTPEHGSVLAGVPVNVVIDFNFDLASPSQITVEKDGVDFGEGETVIDEGGLSMRRALDPNAPDGLYTVNYKACWPDGSCHDGQFQFVIDKGMAERFTDMTGKSGVTIEMSSLSFEPKEIRVSAGTEITWINNDADIHYVNTDSHPAHTYFAEQNSDALGRGDTYSLTFDKPGIYPYHCSAHASFMTGAILVE